MKLVGYDDYNLCMLNCFAITNKNLTARDTILDHSRDGNYYRVPEKAKQFLTDLGGHKVLNPEKIVSATSKTIPDKASVYVHPSCTIPRANIRNKFKRVLSPAKADVCVIPSGDKNEIQSTILAVFIDHDTKIIYAVHPEYARNVKTGYTVKPFQECLNLAEGTELGDINPSIKKVSFENCFKAPIFNLKLSSSTLKESIIHAKFAFYDEVAIIEKKQLYVIDVLENNLHDVILESDIMNALGSNENQLNAEAIDSIRELLTSLDPAVVGLGLKTLSEMDYTKYKNSILYLLHTTNSHWVSNNILDTTGVKYMFKYLDITNKYSCEHYSKDITEEDFNLLKHIVEESISTAIRQMKHKLEDKFPFADINLEINSSVSRR